MGGAGIWLTGPNRKVFKDDHGHRDVTITGNTICCVQGLRRAMWIGAESRNITIVGNTLRGGLIWRGDPPAPDKIAAQAAATKEVCPSQ